MPELAVGVSGLYYDIMEKENTNAIVFATINIPISEWWESSHKIKEHQNKVDMAENKLAETSELLVLQIEKSYKELTESQIQVSIAIKSVEQAKEHLKVITVNYEAGIV